MWWVSAATAQVPVLSGTDATVFRPALSGAFLTVEDGSAPSGLGARLDLRVARDPVQYEATTGEITPVLRSVGVADVALTYGSGGRQGDRLGLHVPVVTWAAGPLAPPAGGLGDLRVDGLVSVAPWLALDGRLALPTGTVPGQSARGGGAEALLVVHDAVGRVTAAVDAGAALGPEAIPGDRRGLLVLPAVGVDAGKGFTAAAEGYLRVPFSAPPVAVARLQGGVDLGGGRALRASIGRGLSGGLGAPALELAVGFTAGAPEARAPGHRDAPAPPDPVLDPDGDGILGEDDACPDEPEDRDGAWDDDGCPEPWVAATVRLKTVFPLPDRWWVEVRDADGMPMPARLADDGAVVFLVPQDTRCRLHVAVPGYVAVQSPLALGGSSSVDVELQLDPGAAFDVRGDILVPIVPLAARGARLQGLEPVVDTVAPLLWNASPWTLAVELRGTASQVGAWESTLRYALAARGVPADRVTVRTVSEGDPVTLRLLGPPHP